MTYLEALDKLRRLRELMAEAKPLVQELDLGISPRFDWASYNQDPRDPNVLIITIQERLKQLEIVLEREYQAIVDELKQEA